MTLTRVRMIVIGCFLMAATTQAMADVGYRSWGPRVGISDDPDQVVGGIHLDLGEFAPRWRWQPSFEIGFGDDVTSIAGNFMVSYYFPAKRTIAPYVGGQITAAYFDIDRGRRGDDQETEIGPAFVAGLETTLRGGTRFLAEVQLGFGDIADVKLMAGWTFK